MNKNNFNLPKSSNALTELNKALSNLQVILAEKPEKEKHIEEKYKKDLASSEEKLNNLKSSTLEVMTNIDEIIKKLDKVFNEDGTNNNNN